MRRKENGMTIIEILISVLIIAIVIALLFNMLIQVRHEDVDNNIQSEFLLSQATFIKTIEEDAVNYGIKRISSCSLSDAGISVELINQGYENNFKCIKIEYEAYYNQDNIGFLLVYNTFKNFDVVNSKYQGRPDTSAWMIQYIRGHYKYDRTHAEIGTPHYDINNPDISSWQTLNQTMRSLPEDIDMSEKPYVLYTAAPSSIVDVVSTNYNAANLVVPIVNTKGEHYDINIAFTFIRPESFKCRKNPNMLECRCKSNDNLCQLTYE